jgi:Domain of unknown function (DUF4160)
MSPTVFRIKGYRFYFLSNEEDRIHIHIECEDGEAKFWIEPIVSLVTYIGLNAKQLNMIEKLIEGRKDEIIKEWKSHFSKS